MHLSDTDIMAWNDRLGEKSGLYVMARYSNVSSQPTIVVKKRSIYPGMEPKEAGDPEIEFRFAYSIAANREEMFFEIFEKLAREPFENHVLNANGTSHYIKFERRLGEGSTRSIHKLYEKEYLRIEHTFTGKLSSIMAYVCLLESAMEYFSMIWGYDESGKEYCLLKYPIGSTVSPADDKSKDFLVIDYRFYRHGPKFIIDYVAAEMMLDKKSPVVKYGPVTTFSEKSLAWSRNGRIDDLLN